MSNADNLPRAIMQYILETSPDAENAANFAATFMMAVYAVGWKNPEYSVDVLMQVAAKRCHIDLNAVSGTAPGVQASLWNLTD